MKMNYKKMLIMGAVALLSTKSFAQQLTFPLALTQLEWKTLQDGEWDDPNPTGGVWEYYKNSISGWILRTQANGPDRSIVRSTVYHNLVFGTCHKSPQTIARTYIAPNATLKGKGDSLRTIRDYGDTLYVDAASRFGSVYGTAGPDAMIDFQFWEGTELNYGKSLILCGTGSFGVSNFKAGASTLPLTWIFLDTINVNQNVSVTSGIVSLYANSTNNIGTDNLQLNIYPGKTILLLDTAAFHSRSNATTNPAGLMTYNINGTLDMSASTGNTNVVASSITSTSVTTMNVNGLVKLGTQFNSVNSGAAASTTNGKVVLNINAGGSVQAIKTLVPNATFKYSTWVSNGGPLRRIVAAADTVFPLQTATSVNNSVIINNAGTKDTFNVQVRDGSSVTWSTPGGIVNKQWSITNSTGSIGQITAKVMWTTADQGSAFVTSGGISAYVFNGSSWVEKPATISGSGTSADPYVATVTPTIDTFNAIVIGGKGLTYSGSGVTNIGINENSVTVAPNPVINGQVALSMGELPTAKYQILVSNAMGQVVSTQTINHLKGNAAYQISLPQGTAAGFYELTISNANTQISKKLIVQ